jgi:hypothetical protein
MKINMFEGARRIAKLIAVIWVVGVCIYVFNSKPYIHEYYRVDSPDSVPTRMGEKVSGCEVEDATEYLFSQHTSKGTDFSLELCFKPKLFDDGRKLIPYRIDVASYYDQLAQGIIDADKAGDAARVRALGAEYRKLKSQLLKPATDTTILAQLKGDNKIEKDPKNPSGFDPDAYLKSKAQPTMNLSKQEELEFRHRAEQEASTSGSWRSAPVVEQPKPNQEKVEWGNEKYSTEVSNYTKMVANGFRLTKADEEWVDSKLWPARWKNIKEGLLATVAGLACLWIFSWGVGWIVRGFAGIPTGQDIRPEVKQTPVA